MDSAVVKITLLNYFGRINQAESPLIVAEFLKDPNRVVVFEALKALRGLSVKFDVMVLLPYVESMSASEQGLALEIITRQANANLVGYLPSYLNGASSKLNHLYARIVVDHVDAENFEKFLLRLSLEDDATRSRVVASLEKYSNRNLVEVAKLLANHDHAFVAEITQQLSLYIQDHRNLGKITEFALSENQQVRERAIRSLGKSTSRDSLSALKILYQVSSGMVAAHEQRVIHHLSTKSTDWYR